MNTTWGGDFLILVTGEEAPFPQAGRTTTLDSSGVPKPWINKVSKPFGDLGKIASF